jgi:hypothetical protein
MMTDWKPEIRRRLVDLQIAPAREAAIIEELAQYLKDCYAELLSIGVHRSPPSFDVVLD